MKLLLIIPFRNRDEHLAELLPVLVSHLSAQKLQTTIVIAEQADNLPFNRGALLNAGFTLFKDKNPSHICFHDVDFVPIKCDYSYSPLVTLLNAYKNVDGNLFSPVVICPTDLFVSSNGFSNEFWGWGYEDFDFYLRTGYHLVPVFSNIWKKLLHEPNWGVGDVLLDICMENLHRFNAYREQPTYPKNNGLSNVIFSNADPELMNQNEYVETFKVKIDLTDLSNFISKKERFYGKYCIF